MCSSIEEYEYKFELLIIRMKELILEMKLDMLQEIRRRHVQVAEMNRPLDPDEPEF